MTRITQIYTDNKYIFNIKIRVNLRYPRHPCSSAFKTPN